MPSVETIEKFILAVEQDAHDEVIERFYTEDASIQENQNPPRVGRDNLIENERKMLKKALSVHSECLRPYFISGKHVAIRWKFSIEWLDGSFTEIEEMVMQEWRSEKIYKERFFYDPKQFTPQKKEE